MSKCNCQIKIGRQEIEKIAGLSYLGDLKLILVKARYLAKKEEVHNIVCHSNSHNMGRISFRRSLLSIFKRFVFGTIHFRTAIDKLICHLDIKRIEIAKQIPAESIFSC